MLVFVAIAGAGPAAAHAVAPAEDPALHWNFETWTIVTLLVASGWYELGVRNLWQRAGSSRLIGWWQIAAFAAGMAAMVVALESPIDTVGEDLFSVHMVQHLMLMLVCAPLLVVGRPVIVMLWAFPPAARRWIGRHWGASGLSALFAWLTSPLSVWLWFSALFVFWHLPVPYTWALRHEPVHVLEHLCFFVSASAFWSVAFEPSGRRRLDYGGRLLFVATAAVLSSLPGALLVLTQRPFYPVHAAGAARWGMTLTEDQQLAGLIMWIPASFAYLGAIVLLLWQWLREAERRSEGKWRRLASGAGCALLLMMLGGCQDDAAENPGSNFAGLGFRGDARQGQLNIVSTGCGSCHTIPGIGGADGNVGPPLTRIGDRIFIAGLLRNTPDNMVLWLREPQRIVPGNAMPDMGLSAEQARDIAAYLYTLR